MELITNFHPFLPSGKEISQNVNEQHLVAKSCSPQIKLANASNSVLYEEDSEDDEQKQFHPFFATSRESVGCTCVFFAEKLLTAMLKMNFRCSKLLHCSREFMMKKDFISCSS